METEPAEISCSCSRASSSDHKAEYPYLPGIKQGLGGGHRNPNLTALQRKPGAGSEQMIGSQRVMHDGNRTKRRCWKEEKRRGGSDGRKRRGEEGVMGGRREKRRECWEEEERRGGSVGRKKRAEEGVLGGRGEERRE
ncbi:hypothetical protein KUDE01_005194 [Dissostichus eleginoides]|uniref:Uncharacterized protein n=2 Tax=Dissostichus eleginoides TaxID=100907 RepID=A0AAD9CGX5_DISEL|nr:hypothetical protein KUDE01_005194 [Dissostichus eleginoides]